MREWKPSFSLKMKLKSIKLVNFQAHGELEVEFSPRISTIKGSTDKGKSAILRALGWVCLNDLAGDSFIKEGEKTTSVGIICRVGKADRQIERARSAGGATNTYELDEMVFRAFGQGVPGPIEELLSLSPLNFQRQHDGPFWFSETAGEVSRQLNAIIDLSVIDSSLAYVASMVRETGTKQKLCQERLAGVARELEDLEPQRVRIQEFWGLEELETRVKDCEKESNRLGAIVAEIDSNSAGELAEHAEDLGNLFRKAKGVRVCEAATEQLRELVEGIELAQGQATAPPDFSPVEEVFDKWNKSWQDDFLLQEQIAEIERAKEKSDRAENRLKEADDRFHEETQGEVCPLCKNPIK